MSHQKLQDLLRGLEEEQRLRLEERRRREEERQLRDRTKEQLRLRRVQIQETTLPRFLDGCHVHLFLGLSIQLYKNSSAKGDPANADPRLRPNKIREWISFPTEQVSVWRDLMDTEFTTGRHFTPLLALKEYGKEARERSLARCIVTSDFAGVPPPALVRLTFKSNSALNKLWITCLRGSSF